MRFASIVIGVLMFFNACDRPPAQKDIPVKNAPQNSVDHSGTHQSSMESSPGAADAAIELQFLDTMIAHHQGAIDMAQLVQTRAAHPELKSMAADIIKDQQKEIEMMRAMREQYFRGTPPAVNASFPGMETGMEKMDIDKLDLLKENAFDLEFLDQMIPHHEGAVEMAKYVISKLPSESSELNDTLRSLARSIVDAQSAEISKMKEWQSAWSKRP